MKFSALLSVALAAFVAAAPAPAPQELEERAAKCTNPLVRKEWRSLADTEKLDFINAVKCLHAKPGWLRYEPGYDIPGAQTRFEDYVAEHQRQTKAIHFVGHFLPWHRNFLASFEDELRKQCKYKGAIPYWNGSLDHGNIYGSPIFDSTTGFGPDGAYDAAAPDHAFGSTGGGCVPSGPFSQSQFTIHLGAQADTSLVSRCLKRNIHSFGTELWLTAAREAQALASPDFETFHQVLEGNMNLFQDSGIHSGGHFGIGGNMGDMYTSPSDPIFYLHHANVDRIWAEWQKIGSNKFTAGGTIGPRIPQLAPVGIPAGVVTLDFKVHLGSLDMTRNLKIAQLADTKGSGVDAAGRGKGVLCYEYA